MASREFPLVDDMIFDILLLLPVKSLLRFKCVSKSWLSLISSPLFIRTHLNQQSSSANRTRLIFSEAYNNGKPIQCSVNSALCGAKTTATDLEFPRELRTHHHPILIVGSCNGLLCIEIQRKRVGIWNPSIGKYKGLPFDRGLRSVSKPHDHVIAHGFGYHDLNDDYKVVKFYFKWPERMMTTNQSTPAAYPAVMVYSTKRNSWRRIEVDLNGFPPWVLQTFHGIFSNGKIHWIMRNLESEEVKILTFDLANEKYGEIQVPEILRHDFSKWNLEWNFGVLGEGCLSFSRHGVYNSRNMEIWFRMDYGTGQYWNKVASIRLQDPCPTYYVTKAVFLSKKGEILFHYGKDLALYNPEKGSTRKLGIRHMIKCCGGYQKVDIYRENLVWVEGEKKRKFKGTLQCSILRIWENLKEH